MGWTTSKVTGLIAGVALGFVGCVSYLADYHFRATAERIASEGDEQRFPTLPVSGTSTKGLCLNAEPLEFCWNINDYGIEVQVSNHAEAAARLLWEGAAFIDETGTKHRLLASKDMLSHCEDILSVVEIGPRAKTRFEVFPETYLNRDPRAVSCLRRTLFDPPGLAATDRPEEIIAIAKPVVGKAIGFTIPVEITDRYEYRFRFEVVDVGARKFADYF